MPDNFIYKTAAVIVAAGKGLRFTGDKKKQFTTVAGRPVIVWTLSAFEFSGVHQIIMAVPPEDLSLVQTEILDRFVMSTPVMLVPGGERRQDSVISALKTLDDDTRFAAIHDGVRCAVSPDDINKVCMKAFDSGAALLAVPSTDSTFAVREHTIDNYVDRSILWCAQTPQVFELNKIIEAHENALKDGMDASDDGSVYHRYIGSVDIVKGNETNIKLTYQRDLILLEEILKDMRSVDYDTNRNRL